MAAVTVSSKGQIVIPKDVRDQLGLTEGDRLEVRIEDRRILLEPLRRQPESADWRRWRGALAGSDALQEHMAEHRDEVESDRLP